ncbi:sulfur carrier protein ThiS [Paenibacillus sp. BR2-3]|uniref:sulfur carrier protein ThiS n=1 Tax=Paenibacillus sp. BR2-3 TaxID=3048494 RepID=UPI0039777897
MKLIINGTPGDYSDTCRTLDHLVSSSEWSRRMIIVELNGEFVSKENYGETHLSDGDRIEIVHFVGGG